MSNKISVSDLNEIYLQSVTDNNLKSANAYLSSRSLTSPDYMLPIGYLDFYLNQELNIKVQESIVIPIQPTGQFHLTLDQIQDSNLNITMLEIRSVNPNIKEHHKITAKSPYMAYYHLFNIHHALKSLKQSLFDNQEQYVIVTESATDALSLMPHFPSTIATLSASIPKTSLHLLSIFPKIIFALDNDTQGIEQTKYYLSFYEKFYPHIKTSTISHLLTEKDWNAQLVSDPEYFNNQLVSEIKDEIDTGI